MPDELLYLAGDYPDPSVVRVGNQYYLTHSSFNWSPGLLIWHSMDLKRWEPLVCALPRYDGDVWAPELIYYQQRFYCYYKTTGGNHVVYADSITGPWSDPIDVGVGYIDPGHVALPDGRRFLHVSDGRMAPLSADGLQASGPLQKVFEPWPIPEDWPIEGIYLEGPKLLFREGWYHLLVAQGGTAGPATSHMVVSARSSTPWGPWEYSPHNPIVHTASRNEEWWSRGHGTLVDSPDGTAWFILYHGYRRGYHTLGRQTLLQPVQWTPEGWPVILPDSAPELLQLSPGITLSDDFSRPVLGWQWRLWGDGNEHRARVGNGELTLTALGDTLKTTAPLACIPGDTAYDATVEVFLDAASDVEAGITLFYNPECCVGLGIGSQGRLRSWYRLWHSDAETTIPPGRWWRVRVRHVEHEALFSLEDPVTGERVGRPTTIETSGFHHNVFGGFLSLRLGLYCIGSGTARFRRFRYTRQ